MRPATDQSQLHFITLGRCPLCREGPRREIFKLRQSSVYECRGCRLRYLDPCLSPEAMSRAYQSDETLAEFHDFHKGYYDYGDLQRPSKTLNDFNRALDLLERKLSKQAPRRILDVGFGNGFFLAAAKKRGWQVRGIDSSQHHVEIARQKFSLELCCASLETFEEPASYDAVSFWDVIEHLPDPHAALKKARALLKPQGYVLIGIPNDHSLLRFAASSLYHLSGGRLSQAMNKVYFLEHVAYYNRLTLGRLLNRNHFRLTDGFATSTDVAKYHLKWHEKMMAVPLLWLGRIVGLENRWVALFQKESP